MTGFFRSLCVLTLFATCLWPQGTERADVLGIVVDASGRAVPGASLKLTNSATNAIQVAKSGEDGSFAFRFVTAGRYDLETDMKGFTSVLTTGVLVQVGINANVSVALKPAQVTESVTVSAQVNNIEIADATVKYSVTNELISGLPIFTSTQGRSTLDQLPFLMPGVHSNSPLGAGNRGEQIVINGSRPSSVAFVFEGGDNNDHEMHRSASPMPNPDALQEFTVVTNNYRADLGRSAGGVISAVAKSGTNDFKGNFRYFLVNEAFNARGFFDPSRARTRLNTYGAQIGGPMTIPWLYKGKDKTFFFFDIEGNSSSREQLYNRDLLSTLEWSGDFSQSTPKPRDPTTGQPFPLDRVPASRINPISKIYVDRWIPQPNLGDRNYRLFIPSSDKTHQYTAKLNQRIGSASNIVGTYFFTVFEQDVGSTTNLPIPSKQNSNSENHNFTLSETHTFSPRAVNQFTGTITRYISDLVFTAEQVAGIGPSEVGITGIRPQSSKFLAPSSIVITGTGVQFVGGANSTVSRKTTWQVKDDFSYTHGKHALKFGGEVRGFIFNKVLGGSAPNGSFGFSTANSFASLNAIGDFMLGLPNSYSQTTGNTLYPRQKALYLYALDDWRIRPNLTLNLGVRWELTPPVFDLLDQASAFRPGAKSQRIPAAPVGLLFVGDPDPALGTVPRGTYPTDRNNIAPRFGVAWSPRGNDGLWGRLLGKGKTAIRGGVGVFLDQTYGFGFTQFSFTQPFQVTQSLTASQMNDARGTFANPFGSLPNLWPLDTNTRTFTGIPTLQPVDPSFRTAYTYQYNLTLQRQMRWSLLAELAYIGSDSFKLNRETEANYAIVGPGATSGNVAARRIYPTFGTIPTQESTGRANFNSMQFRVSRRFVRGLFIDSYYTLGKSLDNGSNPQTSQLATSNPYRWARSSNDRSHSFVTSWTYEIRAKGAGLMNRLRTGWGVGGSFQLRSGLPMDIRQQVDTSLSARFIGGSGTTDYVGGWESYDPRSVRSFVIDGITRTGNYYFNPLAFRTIVLPTDANIAWQSARSGNLGRNVFNGPIQNIWNASFWKRVALFERQQLEVRADVQNLLNHANFSFPGLLVSTPTNFGTISQFQTGGGRNIQMSARYTF